MNDRLRFDESVNELKSGVQKRLHAASKLVVIKGDKPRIPFIERINGRLVTRFILFTSIVLSAIAKGIYSYDSKNKAFKPAGLITERKLK